MKKLVMVIGILALAFNANAQTPKTEVVKDSLGNYKTVKVPKADKQPDKLLEVTFTDAKGKVHPLYQGAKGGIYYWVTSKKTGEPYKKYLPKETPKK